MTPKVQRKLAVGVLGVGLGALVIDRVFLAAPGEASADDTYAVVDPEGEDIGPPPELNLAQTENSIRERLRRVPLVVEGGLCADAFMTPVCWRTAVQAPVQDSQEPAKAVTTFEMNYSLSTVMALRSGEGFVTLVSHKLNQAGKVTLRRGETIDGHKLVRLDERSAMFEGPEGVVTLTLADPHTGRLLKAPEPESDRP